MILVTKSFEFEACHHLPLYKGACHNMHGHSYKLDVTVKGRIIEDVENPKCGMILDFKDLKRIVKENVIDFYDHSNLNDYFNNPTAETMVRQIGDTIHKHLPEGVELVSCKLWETSTSYAEYNPELDKMYERLSYLEHLLYGGDRKSVDKAIETFHSLHKS